MISLLFSSVYGSIKRTPLLSFLIMLLIAIGLGISLPMITVYHNLKKDPLPEKSQNIFRVQLDNWGKDRPFRQPNDPPYVITAQDAQAIRGNAIPVAQAAMFGGEASIDPEVNGVRPFNSLARVTDRDFFSMFDVPFDEGSAWSLAEEQQHAFVIVLSQPLKQRLFGSEPALGKQVRVNNNSYTVVGVLKSWSLTPKFYDMQNPFAPVEDFFVPLSGYLDHGIVPDYWRSPYQNDTTLNESNFESFFEGTEVVFLQYWVQLKNDEKSLYMDFLNSHVAEQKASGRFPRELNNKLSNINEWIEKRSEESQDASGVQALLVVMLLFFVACLLNSMNMLLTKFIRTKGRVAMLRCIGASQRFVFAQYLLEVTVLALAGGILGLYLAYSGLDIAKSLFEHGSTQMAAGLSAEEAFGDFWKMDTAMIFINFGLALFGGILAGLYPAWKICRVPPSSEIKSL